MPQLGAAVHGWLRSTVVDFASPCDPPQPCGLQLTIPVFRSTMCPVAQIAPLWVRSFPAQYDFPHPLDRALRD
jgi:hypothetical protein